MRAEAWSERRFVGRVVGFRPAGTGCDDRPSTASRHTVMLRLIALVKKLRDVLMPEDADEASVSEDGSAESVA